jgi:hypothetical protein
LPVPRNKLWLVLQLLVTAIVLAYIWVALRDQWAAFRTTPLDAEPHWDRIALASVIVLATYAVLIETWRRILDAWGERLAFADAARIWCVTNLGRYLPGKQVWQIAAMTRMAQQRSVSPIAAAGSSIISTIVNIAMGFAVAFVAGWGAADRLARGQAALGLVLAAVLLLGVLLLPAVLPALLATARQLSGRPLTVGPLPPRAVYVALVGNVAAWLLYGIAFQVFVSGVLGSATGRASDYIAAYASSYVIGYLAFAIPGGLGVREGALIAAMTTLQLANPRQAAVIAVTSRLWLTVLEILPGLIYLARGRRPRPEISSSRDGTT